MRLRLLLITCVVWAGLSTSAQTSLSLQQAVDLAKKNNYTLANSKIDQEMAEKKVKEILANGLPQVNATGSYTNFLDIPTQVVPNFTNNFLPPGAPRGPEFLALKFGIPYQASGAISASQLIFDGTFFLGVKAAKEYVNLARLGTKRTETEITAGVTKIYYSALLLQVNMKMLDNTLGTLTKTLNDSRAYYKNGLAEKIDLDRLELGFSNTQIARDKIVDQYALAVLALKLQLGINASDSVILTDDIEKLYSAAAMGTVDAKPDYTARPEYKMLEQAMRLQTFDIRRYKYGYGPSLFASFSAQRITYGNDFGGLGDTWYPTTVFGLNLTVPVFDGFRKSTQIQQSKMTLRKLENDKKFLESSIDNDVQQSKLKFERARQQLEIQKKNMDLAQEIYNRADIKYKNGVGSSLELSTAENDLKLSQTNYLGSMYDMLVAQTDLKKALGLLN